LEIEGEHNALGTAFVDTFAIPTRLGADKHVSVEDERRHRDADGIVIAELEPPDFLAGVRLQAEHFGGITEH